MQSLYERALGQILVDGKFLSRRALERALEEQKQTRELLGEVLVKMGVLKSDDIKAPLLIQRHLNNVEDAVKLAAGERKLLGALLVQSGQIRNDQLDLAIAEQKITGEKLGEVFIRLGMLTQPQLNALLDLQHNQESRLANPLRLGELLLATGYISRQQLDRALSRQMETGKKLGEVLVAEGYALKSQVNRGVRLQRMLTNSVLAALLSLALNSAGSAATVALQWDPSTDTSVVGYKVHYQADAATQPFQGSVLVDVHAVTATEIPDLDPARDYSFAVTAYNAEGAESVYSNIVTIPESVPPTAIITYPAAGTTLSGTVSVTADVADNVAVERVEFYVNGMLLETQTASPHVFSWETSALAAGSYTLTVQAYDRTGNVGQSQSIAVTVGGDAVLPTIALTSPGDHTTVSGAVLLSADIFDKVGVTKTEFYLNGSLLYATNVAPFSYTWDTGSAANGIHVLTGKAYDAAGNIGVSQNLTVNVANDLSAPVVAVTSPANGATLSGTVIVSAGAEDDMGVDRVEFYRNGALVSSGSAPPFSYSWDTSLVANGAYTLTAYAFDAAGKRGESQSVVVTVANDVSAPVVALTFGSSATVSGTTTLVASATDEVAVTTVEFYRDGVLMGTSGVAPYSYTWDTRLVANGTYQITVQAYDMAGNVGFSRSSVTVANDLTAPVVAITSPGNKASVNGTVAVTADATDNVGVLRVDFLVNGRLQASTNATPAAFYWDTKAVADGGYTLTAIAHDEAGNSAQSASVTVNVKNATTTTTTRGGRKK